MSAQPIPSSTPPMEPDNIPSSQQVAEDLVPGNPSLKPLLNPLQTDAPPPASTLVEPPRSPNGANPATDERGINMDLDVPSGPGSAVGPPDDDVTDGLGEDAGPMAVDVPAPLIAEMPSLPPLPRDATPPLTPKAADEPPPLLAVGDIPPAVSTPTVISTEESKPIDFGIPPSLTAPESALRQETISVPAPSPLAPPADPFPGSAPTPAGIAFDPVSSIVDHSVDAEPPVKAEDAMDIDAIGEDAGPSSAPGLESSNSTSSLKRAGEEMGGDEKRQRESVEPSPASLLPPPPVPTAAQAPVAGGIPRPPWETYQSPPARPAGPSTPLTMIQHKHLLNAVRGLKKSKDAPSFLEPVDVVRFGIPHYANIIDRPMDIATVETKLIASDPRGPPKDKSKAAKWDTSKGSYGNVADVVRDVRQMWENTRKFNGPDHVVSQMASRLEATFEKNVASMPAEVQPPKPSPVPSPAAATAAAAGPSTARRASISQPPTIRRTSDGPDSRPKREIHPPPSKDLAYADTPGTRKPKRRNDPQLQWASRTFKTLETTTKYYDAVSPFLYSVDEIIAALPDYARIVKRPIDLNIIKNRLNEGEYDDVSQVHADIKLMTSNAIKFNPPDHAVHSAALQFQQLWEEKYRQCPPKQDVRDDSEDPLAEEFVEEESSDEDTATIRMLEGQISEMQRRVNDLKGKKQRRKASRAPIKRAAPKPKARKQSMSKPSPNLNGNGVAKKSRKKDIAYDDEEDDSEAEGRAITMTQKQELAEKIGVAEPDILTQAIQIIQQSTELSSNEEIELDIDSLPPRAIAKLYRLVCLGDRKAGRKSQGSGQNKKPGRKATGGFSRKSMNEQEEAERIRRMEAQLQSFEGGRQNTYDMGAGGHEESDSSEEESSDEE